MNAGVDAALQPRVCFLQPLVAPQRAPQLDLRPHRRQQPVVVPRLLDVVARAAPHRFDRARDAAPRRHDEHGQRRIERADPLHQVESFLAGGRVARVVQVEDREVEVGGLEPLERLAGRARGVTS